MYLTITFQGFQCLFSNDHESEGFGDLVHLYLPTYVQTEKAELSLWHTKLLCLRKSPKQGLDAIKLCNRELFPNLFVINSHTRKNVFMAQRFENLFEKYYGGGSMLYLL